MSGVNPGRRRWAELAFTAGLCVIGPAVAACGLEDPSSISMRRGILNMAYPESLHVGTAVWQAQLAGQLPPDPFAQRDDLTPEVRGALGLVRANGLLHRFAAQLGPGGAASSRPRLAVVLLGPVMWSRFEVDGEVVKSMLHVTGPERGDVVVVTDVAVVEAIGSGAVSPAEALASGLMRLYGPTAEVAAAQEWLSGRAPV